MSQFMQLALLIACISFAGCKSDKAPAAGTPPDTPSVKADKGVDATAKVIKIGALNDESGPAAGIGKPFAVGKRLAAARVNAGNSGLLPEGWKVELVERDHGYNPQKSVQAYNEIKDEVLFFGTSFGTPNTLPLRDMLQRDNALAFPASLSSAMAKNQHTPPLAPDYAVEAERAMDHFVKAAGGADKIKAGIVYQKDDYGEDGLKGWKTAAARHGVKIVSEQTVAPGQKDMAAVVTGLKDAGATHVLLTVLPSATGPVLGTAAQMKYMPTWVGNTPAWIDAFFIPEVIPSAVFTNYLQANGIPYWGEEVPGMKEFLAAWDTYGKDMGKPDFYVLASYIQGLTQLEAARRAIEAGDITRQGYRSQVKSLKSWSANGMIEPIDLSGDPYVVGTKTRILKPDFEKKSWTEVAPYAAPGS
jgi:ABC-type branched-subunit amino acid transport system substrate-binding protein